MIEGGRICSSKGDSQTSYAADRSFSFMFCDLSVKPNPLIYLSTNLLNNTTGFSLGLFQRTLCPLATPLDLTLLKLESVCGKGWTKLHWEAYWQWYTRNKCLVLIFKMRGVVVRYYLCPLVYKFWWEHCCTMLDSLNSNQWKSTKHLVTHITSSGLKYTCKSDFC